MRQKNKRRNKSRHSASLRGVLIPFLAVCCTLSIAAIVLYAQNKPGAPDSQASAQSLTEAKATYESICASCHGLDGHSGERGPDIASRAEVVDKKDGELAEILKNGKTAAGMPAFAGFGDTRIAGLVAYLRTLQGHGDEAPVPGDAANGKALFFGKAKCANCHIAGGQGGFFAEDLTSYASRMNADDVRAKILNPDRDLDPRRGMVNVVLVDSSTLSGTVRNEDNFSLQLQTLDGVFHLVNKTDIRTQTYAGKSAMPSDYGSTLSPAELNDLVSYLLRVSKSKNKQSAENQLEDGDED
jgi:cytochrome c oxidase cbb3-type subunit III